MKTTKLSGHKIEYYDSIDELPINRFQKFNKYMLIDSGIGSDLNDINQHIAKIQRFIDTDSKAAKKQLENLRQSLYFVSEGISANHLSFIVLIKSIDGKPFNDLSDDNIQKTLNKLSNTSQSLWSNLISKFKKKVDTELNLYFPSVFSDVLEKEYLDKIRRKTLLILDEIIREKDNEKEIYDIDTYMLTLVKPKTFIGKESSEIKYDKAFEEICIFLKKELDFEVTDETTVFKFYSSLEFIKTQNKKNGR